MMVLKIVKYRDSGWRRPTQSQSEHRIPEFLPFPWIRRMLAVQRSPWRVVHTVASPTWTLVREFISIHLPYFSPVLLCCHVVCVDLWSSPRIPTSYCDAPFTSYPQRHHMSLWQIIKTDIVLADKLAPILYKNIIPKLCPRINRIDRESLYFWWSSPVIYYLSREEMNLYIWMGNLPYREIRRLCLWSPQASISRKHRTPDGLWRRPLSGWGTTEGQPWPLWALSAGSTSWPA